MLLVLVFMTRKYTITQFKADPTGCKIFSLASVHMNSADQLLSQLNESQRQAVTHVEGPLMILAGPGSGKTRVVSHRVAHMIGEGIPSHSIVALTFTNKAAEEMRHRISHLVPGGNMWTGTFHRFCSRMLRQYATLVGLSENFTIYDTGDSKKVIKQAIGNVEVDLQHHSPNTIFDRISNLKSNAVTCQEFQPRSGDFVQAIVARVYPEYQKLMQMANAVDFDDLLLYCVDLLRQNPDLRESFDLKYQYMMVDEYQDTNLTQYQLIRLLNHNVRNLAVTGDPDQSIYGWRGANLNNILEFENDFPNLQVVRLEQNYRSTKSILQVADQLITFNKKRKPKSLVTDNDEGAQVRMVAFRTAQDEATEIVDAIALAINKEQRRPRDFAVLYRTNYLSRVLEHAFRSAAVPYQVLKALEFYQRREVKDVLAYLHLINNPSDSVAFERIINVPPRKIGKVTVTKIRNYAMQKGIPLLRAARECGLITEIGKGAATKVAKFVTMFDEISETGFEQVEVVLKNVIFKTGYRDWLTADGSEEGHERAANVEELLVAAQEFDTQHPDDGGLERYLEQAALVSDTDAWESDSDYVSLMTLHAAKGLEFPCVFIVGLEDGILPHERSIRDPDQIEEERRLLFVGITRAKEDLQLSRCLTRFRKGSLWPCIASSFLMELPRDSMQIFEPQASQPVDHDVDDIPFDIDPWAHGGEEGGYEPEEIDARGIAHGEKPPENGAAGKLDDVKQFPRLMTGAELAKKHEETIRQHPSMYREGMTVKHAEYGTGVIEDLSGKNLKRTATVAFKAGKKRFRLAFCDLKIVGQEA